MSDGKNPIFQHLSASLEGTEARPHSTFFLRCYYVYTISSPFIQTTTHCLLFYRSIINDPYSFQAIVTSSHQTFRTQIAARRL